MAQQTFALAVNIALARHLYTANAATRHMGPPRSGVILAITADAARTAQANMGGFGVACAADVLEQLNGDDVLARGRIRE